MARRPARDGDAPERLVPERPRPGAYQQALGLLVRREHSRKELGRKLQGRGTDPTEIETALESLVRSDYQNDSRFAQALARTRAQAGYGPVWIRAELATHGLGRSDIDLALETCDTDWPASARRLLARRHAGKDLSRPGQRRKALDLLLRRGFEQKTAHAAVAAALREGGEPEET